MTKSQSPMKTPPVFISWSLLLGHWSFLLSLVITVVRFRRNHKGTRISGFPAKLISPRRPQRSQRRHNKSGSSSPLRRSAPSAVFPLCSNGYCYCAGETRQARKARGEPLPLVFAPVLARHAAACLV